MTCLDFSVIPYDATKRSVILQCGIGDIIRMSPGYRRRRMGDMVALSSGIFPDVTPHKIKGPMMCTRRCTMPSLCQLSCRERRWCTYINTSAIPTMSTTSHPCSKKRDQNVACKYLMHLENKVQLISPTWRGL